MGVKGWQEAWGAMAIFMKVQRDGGRECGANRGRVKEEEPQRNSEVKKR